MSTPSNTIELRSLLGAVNQLGRFVPNLQQRFEWKQNKENVLKQMKKAVRAAISLTHFNVSKPLFVSIDASAAGIEAVVGHAPDQLIVVVSRVLSKAEQNYSISDREALAIMFAVRKFYQYIVSRRFTITCDH